MKNLLILLLIFFLTFTLLEIIFSIYSLKKASNLIPKYTANDMGNGSKIILLDGDSIAVGVGSSSPENSIQGRIYKEISKNTSITLRNRAISGSKIADLKEREVEENNLTILIISSNDLLYFTNLKEFEKDSRYVISKYLNKTENLILIGPGMLDTVSGIPSIMKPIYRLRAKKIGKILEDISKEKNFIYVNPYKEEKSSKYGFMEAEDNFHPNDNGHLYWSDLAKIGLDKLDSYR